MFCRKILELVGELHLRGYEGIRISPGMSPSGTYWRCNITPASNISPKHGAQIVDYEGPVAQYSSGDGDMLFGWTDAKACEPSELAVRFIERFPEIAAAGKSKDSAYVAWYREMLTATHPDAYPIAYADWDLPEGYLSTIGNRVMRMPLPPPSQKQMFEAAIASIEAAYPRLGHTLGWRFLYSPKDTLDPMTEVVFIGLNPGGKTFEEPKRSFERGNAYLWDPWDSGEFNRLQKQVQAFYQLFETAAPSKSRDQWMDASLAANFIPFRSGAFDSLEKRTEVVQFAYKLWRPIFERLQPRVLVTMGVETTRHVHELLSEIGKVKLGEPLKCGWGSISGRLGSITLADGRKTLLIALPHLSRFPIFNRPQALEFTKAVTKALKQRLSAAE